MKCKKDGSRTCGAGWRNEIFNLDGVKATPVPKYVTIVGESQLGCYQDRGNRDLPTLIREGYGDPKTCFQMAKDRGFKYAGLQYRGECWAGNAYGKHGKRPDSECNMKCKKNPSRTCGAGWRNEIFNVEGVKKTAVVQYKTIIGETQIGCY